MPDSAAPHLRLAQLAWVEDPVMQRENVYLAELPQIAPSNTEVLIDVGELFWNAGRSDRAISAWKQAMELTETAVPEVFRVVRNLVPTDVVLNEILPPSPVADRHRRNATRRRFVARFAV